MRGVRYRGFGNGAQGGTYPSSGLVSAEPLDRASGENYKEPQRARVVPRVPEFEEKVVGRGDMGRRVLCPDSRRPDDSGRYHEVYSASSRTRARACAASFEAALLMPRGLPRGYLLNLGLPVNTRTKLDQVWTKLTFVGSFFIVASLLRPGGRE